MSSVDLRDVVKVGTIAALAAQRYIQQYILKGNLQSLQVTKKADLGEFKEGAAAIDLVTDADHTAQELILWALEMFLRNTEGGAHGITCIGEEEEATSPASEEKLQLFAEVYMQAEDALKDALALLAAGTANTVVPSSSVAVYIDPVDGTNCFVQGIYHVPLTLIGVTVDGLPVGAIANRVFVVEPQLASMCFCLENVCLFRDGEARDLSKPFADRLIPDTLISYSKTTKRTALVDVIESLEPLNYRSALDSGAGNKLMKLCNSTVAMSGRNLSGSMHQDANNESTVNEAETPADIFLAVPRSIKWWDTCAPHAFIRVTGGEIFDWEWNPLRYDHRLKEGETAVNCDLAKGVLGVSGFHREAEEAMKKIAKLPINWSN